MRHKIGNVISVAFSFVKLTLMKMIYWKRLKFYFIERLSPNVVIDIRDHSSLQLGKKVRAHSGTRFTVAMGGKMVIGDNVRINNNCRFACRNSIEIGEGAEFGPGVLVYDHDHDFRAAGGIKEYKFITDAVKIGKNVWIGANTIILRGTVIGDNSVVAAGSVLKGTFPDDTLIYQKRENLYKNISVRG